MNISTSIKKAIYWGFRNFLRSNSTAIQDKANKLPDDISEILRKVQPHTMTSPERITALIESVRYVVRRDIPGAFVECGVWRGGSVMAMILTLQALKAPPRAIYLYDTFEGMTEPSEHDASSFGSHALDVWNNARRAGEHPWHQIFAPTVFNLDLVKSNLAATGYPMEMLHFVKGPVETTIPAQIPTAVALLRLDTDWYESTLHELQHLYPKLQLGGALIIDDYGHWDGCRRAVDEYFSRPDVPPVLLNRIDYTGRLAIKV